jgi:signal transduction histidine kinase
MSSETNTEKPRILVVDDEQVIRDLFEKFLSKEDYIVSTAVDGLEVLEKVRNDYYNMLILDLKMPKMEGMEVLDRVRDLNRDLIIIIVTGYATLETAKEAIKKGCFDYITKPFNIEDVSIIIKRAFDVKRWSEEKKKLQEQLRVAERLASLAQMGAGVVHEINTMLTSIKLFLEMLKSKLPQTQKEAKNINLVLEEIGHAEKLIVRFLSFTKPEKGEFIKADINKLIKQNLQIFKYKLEKNNIEVLLDFKDETIGVLCDPLQIGEVFLNLVSNSIDAMPEGGCLTISSEVKEKNAVVIVSDTGIGISSEDMEKVFDPFFTTKPHGTGLGLSIVHRIIQEHRGSIKISSEKDKGTSVQIELPIS